MGKEDIVIECIAEESFNNFCEIVDATSILRQDKQIVIFGSGNYGNAICVYSCNSWE